MSKQTSHTLMLVAGAFIWGMAFVAQSMGAGLGAYTFLACRSWLGVVTLLPLVLWRRRQPARKAAQAPRGALWRGGLLCGTFLFAASAAQQIAITIDPSTAKAGFITAMYVVLVPLAGCFLGRRCGGQVWAAVAAAVVGLYLLCMQEGFGGLRYSDGLLLLCAVLFAGQILSIDRFSPVVDGVELSILEFFVTAVWSTVFMFALEQPAWADIAANALPILYCGVLSSGVGYTLQILGQKGLHPAIASIAMCLESVFGALGGWLILHQTLTARELAGCGVIFAAVVLAQVPLETLRRRRA